MAIIENVSDTAKWVAVYRAMETERRDAIFRDPYAARLAGDKGRAIVDNMHRGKSMAWAMIVRTAIFDEIILDRVRNGSVDTVLNLAAGLDARAWRLSLPPTLRWIDADLPGILDYKVELMKDETPACQYEAIRIDLTDAAKRDALFAQVNAASSRVLVVTEGLLIYLPPEEVALLAQALHAQEHFRWWLFDLANDKLLAMMRKFWDKDVQAGNAAFLFGPAEGTKFFEPFGWCEVAFRSAMEEAHRLKREMRYMWFWRALGRLRSSRVGEEFRRFNGFALLERT